MLEGYGKKAGGRRRRERLRLRSMPGAEGAGVEVKLSLP
jgi:hypothetical protein